MDVLARLSTSLSSRYAIEREIGTGGMATVYLARDLRHNRRVALKVLHPELSAVIGSERFLKEIELTANLQHPHILPLFDSGEAEGLLYYVMPFVEGESLRARLERERQLPVADALRLTTEVAGALEYAHRHGLVHRDIKPENILLQEGQALLADFGIALAVQSAGGERMTQTGLSLGTPHYMAPEQATGERGVDARADVYALGAVMYEMLAGEPPFTGPTTPAVLSRVLTERPRSVRLGRPQVPEHVEAALERALEKLPADRWQTAKELADALAGTTPVSGYRTAAAGTSSRGQSWRASARSPLVLAVAAIALLALTGMALLGIRLREAARDAAALPAVRFEFVVPDSGSQFEVRTGKPLAFAPDGRAFIYKAAAPGQPARLYLREISDASSRALPGSEDALDPSFSPDGRSVVFMVGGGGLRRVSLAGGGATRISDRSPNIAGTAWGGETIVFGTDTRGLEGVMATGGVPETLTRPDTAAGVTSHRWPVVLPDGETVLFSAWGGNLGNSRVGIASLSSGKYTVLDLVGFPLGTLDGMLIYHDGVSSIYGVPVDLKRGLLSGAPVSLAQSVAIGVRGPVKAALSANGSLIYTSGPAITNAIRELVRVGLDGAERPLDPLRRAIVEARYAPDGRRVALTIGTEVGTFEVWILDTLSGTLQPLSAGVEDDRPEWSPDGRDLLVRRAGGIWRVPADGSGQGALLQAGASYAVFTPDGGRLLYRSGGGFIGGNNLWMRSLTGDTASRRLAVSPTFQYGNPAVSPDGRWIAYPSDESGKWQIYLQPFPGLGPKYAVSLDGGDNLVWAPDGRRLYYSNGPQITEAVITTTPTFQVSRRPLFMNPNGTPFYRNWDLAPDGSHFLINRVSSANPARKVFVIHNWAAEVRARLASR
jgi:Tol biopolymer transport system component/tRNA A-37 threonylcarbamoyl transferase component Bud32